MKKMEFKYKDWGT